MAYQVSETTDLNEHPHISHQKLYRLESLRVLGLIQHQRKNYQENTHSSTENHRVISTCQSIVANATKLTSRRTRR